jgi:hypothetical protein
MGPQLFNIAVVKRDCVLPSIAAKRREAADVPVTAVFAGRGEEENLQTLANRPRTLALAGGQRQSIGLRARSRRRLQRQRAARHARRLVFVLVVAASGV